MVNSYLNCSHKAMYIVSQWCTCGVASWLITTQLVQGVTTTVTSNPETDVFTTMSVATGVGGGGGGGGGLPPILNHVY